MSRLLLCLWDVKTECHRKGEDAILRGFHFAVFLTSILVSGHAVINGMDVAHYRIVGS